MDSGWRFHLGNDWGSGFNFTKAAQSSGPADTTFNDTAWRKVNLPHDWAVEVPFDKNSDMSHGYKPVGPGFPSNSIAWYRRTFELLKTDAGKRLWLEFDGVYRNCDVFVNGWFVGNHKSGYDGFRYDITDVANYGSNNVVAVRVNASEFEGWFYEGAGIYRHVWLEKTSPLAIAPDGVFIYSKFKNNVPEGDAEIHVQTRLKNTLTNNASVAVTQIIYNPPGTIESSNFLMKFERKVTVPPLTEIEITNIVKSFKRYELWSPESPKLYKLVTLVSASGGSSANGRDDEVETEFGIRTLAFDATNGFLLNGKRYPIQGTCNHQDMAGVGSALPDALQYFRIMKLKEMGCNAYRTSHNAPTPELLDACDHLGMLVLDENRLVGSDEENLRNLRGQILRDRNHPSVFAWSLGNEEWSSQGTAAGAASIRTMQELTHSLDPTRLCTVAINGSYGNSGFITILDVKGFNYNLGSINPYHKSHANSLIIGSETASTVTTRGIYTNDLEKGYVAAYDYITRNKSGALTNPVTWGETAEEWWTFYDARPWSSGGFAWTGFDYRGEPTPYEWPCINSHFGIMDMCGFPKDNFYYYQSVWTTNTILHLLPHWNWAGKEGQEISVWAYSNCKEVELFLNGQSLGKQTMKKNSHLEWRVKYTPGTLSAKGFDATENVIAEAKVETTGEPAAIQLAPDRATINADAEDVSAVKVQINDTQNREVPTATNEIIFEISGPGKIIGVGNGDPSSHEPDKFVENVRSLPITNWHFKKADGATNQPEEVAADFDDSSWPTEFGEQRGNTNQVTQTTVYRGNFELPENSGDSAFTLFLRSLGENQSIYLNGHLVAKNASREKNLEISLATDDLRSGKNVIAIVATPLRFGYENHLNHDENQNSPGLIRMITPAALWQRSVFNGLAQIIVQSTGQPGEIMLTAKSQGVTDGVLKIQAQPAVIRPAMAAN